MKAGAVEWERRHVGRDRLAVAGGAAVRNIRNKPMQNLRTLMLRIKVVVRFECVAIQIE